MQVAVSEVIVRFMERLGVDHIFGMPGAHILPVYDALYDTGIKTVLAKHEHVAEPDRGKGENQRRQQRPVRSAGPRGAATRRRVVADEPKMLANAADHGVPLRLRGAADAGCVPQSFIVRRRPTPPRFQATT